MRLGSDPPGCSGHESEATAWRLAGAALLPGTESMAWVSALAVHWPCRAQTLAPPPRASGSSCCRTFLPGTCSSTLRRPIGGNSVSDRQSSRDREHPPRTGMQRNSQSVRTQTVNKQSASITCRCRAPCRVGCPTLTVVECRVLCAEAAVAQLSEVWPRDCTVADVQKAHP
jgi:hypothetical protein